MGTTPPSGTRPPSATGPASAPPSSPGLPASGETPPPSSLGGAVEPLPLSVPQAHRAQIGAALEQVGGEAVAQRVRIDAPADPGRPRVAGEQLPEALPRHAAAARRDEEVERSPRAEELLPRPVEPRAERIARPLAD